MKGVWENVQTQKLKQHWTQRRTFRENLTSPILDEKENWDKNRNHLQKNQAVGRAAFYSIIYMNFIKLFRNHLMKGHVPTRNEGNKNNSRTC